MATMGSEIMNQRAFSPDLGSSDFHLFGPMKMYIRGQLFQIED
jgi:hypothetical protein